ncbi:MAG: glycoside hydrolase family 2 [Chitinophagaceae bacterium]|nr:MAG: glycoside hydrolase family 2 [Chitinophagaceae bacterium]
MKRTRGAIFLFVCLLTEIFISQQIKAQSVFKVKENFRLSGVQYDRVGRGMCQVKDGILRTQNAYASFGDSSWSDYQFTVDAKVPVTAKQVQIWCGFRAADRNDRYIIGLKGGIQNDLYLGRLGYMGKDDFLALRHLNFSLKPGETYTLKIQAAGGRIRVFLNNENLPRIDIVDKNADLEPKGKVTLGGSWIENDFSHLSIESLSANALSKIPVKEFTVPPVDKEALRRKERATYKIVDIKKINKARTIVSLDGKWLFKPGYETMSDTDNLSPLQKDESWHILTVPDFWNPDRIWLFGETYGSASKGVSDSYYQKETDRCEAYTFSYKKTNIGWYRQWIDLPESIKGKHLELHFDAVSKMAEVWINGKKAGSHIGMFGDFNLDGTGLFKPGKNLIVVKVYKNYLKNTANDNKIVSVAVSEEVTQKMLHDLPHGFFDEDPAGIWQPVSLVITNPVEIKDVFIKPNLQGASFDISIKNYSNKPQQCSLNTAILSVPAHQLLFKGSSIENIHLNPGEEKQLTYAINDLKPKLWSPAHPHLYDFHFILDAAPDQKIDEKVIRSGFKTFEVRDGYFYLNGRRYWLRGADQTAMPIAPNDTALASRFCRLMHEGNINVTRTHTTPYTETWMNASDKYGIGISFEGTWPWLMIGNSPIPDSSLLKIWKNEYFDLMKKYRNHPSMLIWTINNEMNFYADDPDKDRAEKKMRIISDVVKQMRKIDPTHPICFSSNYSRKQTERRFGKAFMKDIDDGDMDDIHYYPNWYNNSIFDDFKGEFQQAHKYPDRPLISQELSTGYPDETGHPTRFYTYVHQTPQATIGNYAYAFNDPYYFLATDAFITKEEAEALRRTNPEAAGILHFSLATWFKDVYLAKKIQPFPTYYALKKALQPVLISAELWGRHFYAGTPLPVRFCIVNDQENGDDLPPTTLRWQLVGDNGKAFAGGSEEMPPVKYYGRQWIEPKIDIPKNLPQHRVNGKLILNLYEKNKLISQNDYDLLFADKAWIENTSSLNNKKLIVVDPEGKISPILDFLSIKYELQHSIKKALQQPAGLYVFSGLDSLHITQEDVRDIKTSIKNGNNILWLNGSQSAVELYPDDFRGIIHANDQIVNMDIPESPLFDQMDPLDIRYFNNNKREIPTVCDGAFQINRNRSVRALASSEKVHGYLQGGIEARSSALDKIKGFPIVKIRDGKGSILFSTMRLNKGTTDPVAGKLFMNMLTSLLNQK